MELLGVMRMVGRSPSAWGCLGRKLVRLNRFAVLYQVHIVLRIQAPFGRIFGTLDSIRILYTFGPNSVESGTRLEFDPNLVQNCFYVRLCRAPDGNPCGPRASSFPPQPACANRAAYRPTLAHVLLPPQQCLKGPSMKGGLVPVSGI